jgi:wyosine [tRNA(Phe)-imidazoG37] synthetase (radical SAM superfamily)
MTQATFTPLFTKHSREWRENRYVYPVISRRSKGLSIGVNLNPDKVCNFDCVYCCVDRTEMPGKVEVDLDVLHDELGHMIELAATKELFEQPPFDQTPAVLRRLNDVAFSGDGEPTAYPKFTQACTLASGLLHQAGLLSTTKIVVITNATLFHQPRVQEALEFLDTHNGEIWAKLDAGSEAYYQKIERSSVPFARILDNLLLAGRARPIVVQTLFMRLHGQAPSQDEIDAYVGRLRVLIAGGCQIKLVQIYTVARGTAEAYATPMEAVRLDAISAQVRAQTGLNVETFYGPG